MTKPNLAELTRVIEGHLGLEGWQPNPLHTMLSQHNVPALAHAILEAWPDDEHKPGGCASAACKCWDAGYRRGVQNAIGFETATTPQTLSDGPEMGRTFLEGTLDTGMAFLAGTLRQDSQRER